MGYPFAEGWKASKEGRRKKSRPALLREKLHILRNVGLSFTSKSC